MRPDQAFNQSPAEYRALVRAAKERGADGIKLIGLAVGVPRDDLAHDGRPLAVLGLVDLIVAIVPDHRQLVGISTTPSL